VASSRRTISILAKVMPTFWQRFLGLRESVRPSLFSRALRNVHTLLLTGLLGTSCGAFRAPAPAPHTPDPSAWSKTDLTIAYLGHASVLIDFGGTLLLTDPALYDRVGLSLGPVTVGPKRLVAPALAPQNMPKLDVVLVSHAHMDSLDRRSLRSLSASPLLVVPERTGDLVDDLHYPRVVELGWGSQVASSAVVIESVPVRHWGRRWPWERERGYCGYLLSRGDVRVLFASDTAYSPELAAYAKQRHVTVAILGIGAYDPWVWNHETPEQAWQTFVESGARYLIPVHWDTFRLGKEPIGEAIRRLLAAAGPDAGRVVIREIGETWTMKLGGS
jgi:L-ascorbate metabolism protein UlaG (beta-lactamase superfamily)